MTDGQPGTVTAIEGNYATVLLEGTPPREVRVYMHAGAGPAFTLGIEGWAVGDRVTVPGSRL